MVDLSKSDPILRFDTAVQQRLSDNLKDVPIYESVEDGDGSTSPQYIVFFGNDVVQGEAYSYGSITGAQDDAFIHQFSVLIVARNKSIRNAVVSAVRQLLVGTVLDNASGIRETGMQNGYGDTDGTLKPVKFTYFITFSVTMDRSDNA